MSKMRPLARLSVWLGQTLVGGITELPNDRNIFVFDQSYIGNRNRPVLSLSFFNAEGNLNSATIETQTKVAPFFSNLLPEEDLRRYVARLANVKEVRDLPLLQLLGEDLPGAVVVRSESDGPPPEGFEEDLTVQGPSRENQPLRFSLAGVQMKFSAAGSPEKGLTIPVEGRGGHWIVKLPSQRYPLVPENEHSMMQFARAVGIDTAETGLVPTEEIEGLPEPFRTKANSLWVRRFDRTHENTRIHMEDFNQLYRQFPREKYDNYSYGNMAKDLASIADLEAVREFVSRLIFSAAIGNADMHLKNWTLLYQDGRTPKLSPAYDFVSTIAYLDDFTMALSVSKEKDVRKFDRALLTRFAAKVPVPERLMTDAAMQTAERMVTVWPQIREDLVMSAEAKERVTKRMQIFPLTRQFMQ
ncbi:HipA N-terminal domain protein [Granulicella mallensis MP5ACTX8]|uniref:HipA N-terminal domain protein n=2 Tax=Granulicella mallensis TaxID=940614 RepID=G8NZI0_GRAMM|nr:HipA N-terminal domain protein [Granulicella mallensis MP5ACTX8]